MPQDGLVSIMDWFLDDSGLRHEKVKERLKIRESVFVKEKIVANRFCKNSFINPLSYSFFFFNFLKYYWFPASKELKAEPSCLEKEKVYCYHCCYLIFLISDIWNIHFHGFSFNYCTIQLYICSIFVNN